MAEYIGHILTALGLVIAGAVGFGVLRNIVMRTKEDTKDQEMRLRVLEAAKLQMGCAHSGSHRCSGPFARDRN